MRGLSLFMFKHFLSIILCSFLTACYTNKIILFYSLSQVSANQIILQLEQNNIHADKQIQKDGTFDIMILSNDQLSALKILNKEGGIKAEYSNLGTVFKKDGFISSPLEEHARLEYALDQEISDMLSQIDGILVIKTEVGLPIPNDNLWQSEAPHPSASVLIKYRSGSKVDLYANRIRDLVTHSIPGLHSDQVDILMVEQHDDSNKN